jgi:nucleoside-diphosphate-sugar epimerase
MMRWLTESIATAAFNDVKETLENNVVIVDVRDLVDKSGNDIIYINTKIDESVSILKTGKKIVICCDYGMSRSNSIAIGVIIKMTGIDFAESVNLVKNIVDENGIKIEMLDTVYRALYKNQPPKKDKSNILLTGGSGFLGRSLSAMLSKTYEVIAVNRNMVDLLNEPIKLDLLIKSKNIDVIIHLANPKIFTTNRSTGDTLVMLKNVLDACRTNGNVKLVYLSGWEVYSGYKSNGLLCNEFTIPNPKGTYGETKWLCELLIKQYAQNYNVDYQIIRSGPIYGLDGDKPKFIYNFIGKAKTNEEIVTHNYINGHPGLDLLFIDDLTNIIVKAVNSDFVGEVNIGSGTLASTNEIAHLICDLLHSKSTIRSININEYAPNIIMDTALARKTFDWKPTVNFRDGIDRVINSYKLQNYLE